MTKLCQKCGCEFSSLTANRRYCSSCTGGAGRGLLRRKPRVLCDGARHIRHRTVYAAVHRAIRAGVLQKASSLKCVDCGNDAVMYDHYKGYGQKHWLDVEPVCRK